MSSSLPITASDRLAVYTATLGQTTLSVPFPFQAASDLAVRRTRAGVTVALAYGDDFTVVGENEASGGTLTLTEECEGGEIFVVYGATVRERLTGTTQAGRFNSALLEHDFDRLTLIAQELARDIGRAVKVEFGGTGPAIATGAEGYLPMWDAHGDLVQGPSSAALAAVETALAVAAGRALVHGEGAADPYDAGTRAVVARQLGINATPDTTNPLSANIANALLSAVYAADGGDGSLRVKLNKEVEAGTASLLLQSGFSGRAEIGLAGDDDLSVKVSPDGAAWITALSIDRTTGVASFGAPLSPASIPLLDEDDFASDDPDRAPSQQSVRAYLGTGAIEAHFDGGGAEIADGTKVYLEVPFACTITAARALADQVGSIVVDVWKDTYANYPPADADSITAAAPVTIAAATKSEDDTLTGWTRSLAAGDVLVFNVDSCTTIRKCTVSLRIMRA